ncbi:MAG: hypothetical protein K2Q09_04190 [Phycisphaerales bacterium]|nr:hypothetical protein [Phycisphaerales bacterium]
MKTTRIMAVVAIVASAGLGACNNNKDATDSMKMEAKGGPVNTTCPVSGKQAKGDVTTQWDGKTVAFCCGGCKGKFEKMDHTQQASAVAKAN